MKIQRAVLLTSMILTGCPSTLPPMLSQPKELAVEGTYIHRPSHIAFPSAIKTFTRSHILQYDAVGETISVEYKTTTPTCIVLATVTLYVAPSHTPYLPTEAVMHEARTALVQEHFNGLKRGLLQTHRDAKLLREEDTTIFQVGGTQRGRRGLFEYQDSLSDATDLTRADLYLFTMGKWALKYRFVYTAAVEPCASAAVDEFLLAFQWSVP